MIQKLKENQTLWDIFTAKPEYEEPVPDEHGRLEVEEKIQEPIVSNFLLESGLKLNYPNRKKFAICLSHDIDVINSHRRLKMAREALEAFARGRFSEMGNKLLLGLQVHRWAVSEVYKARINPLYNFDKIMALEAANGAKSSFYFLSLESNDHSFDYDIKSLQNLLKRISDGGWEVGLHGGYNAYLDAVRIKEEKTRLEQVLGKPVIGYRNHYLRFATPKTWEILAACGFLYDSTFGYHGTVGFRNGLALPFRPYNLKEKRFIDIWELPLVVMDTALFRHMKLNQEEALALVKDMIDKTAQANGVMTLLWHNNYLTPEYLEVYEKILQYANQKQAWLTSGEQIANWANENLDKVWKE